MTIYTRFGTEVRFRTARERVVYVERRRDGEILWHYSEPKKSRATRSVETMKVWHVTAEYADDGKPAFYGQEVDINAFRANDGIREIHAECERIAAAADRR